MGRRGCRPIDRAAGTLCAVVVAGLIDIAHV